jgi:hypothetical protein
MVQFALATWTHHHVRVRSWRVRHLKPFRQEYTVSAFGAWKITVQTHLLQPVWERPVFMLIWRSTQLLTLKPFHQRNNKLIKLEYITYYLYILGVILGWMFLSIDIEYHHKGGLGAMFIRRWIPFTIFFLVYSIGLQPSAWPSSCHLINAFKLFQLLHYLVNILQVTKL